MSLAELSFYASAAVALLAALGAVVARSPRRSLAGFAVALAALIVPLIQLRAAAVAGVVLLSSVVIVALLGGLAGLAGPRAASRGSRPPLGFWILGGLGLAGFCWVLLATGSRQVVELAPDLSHGAGFGEGPMIVDALGGHMVAALIVGLLALCAVIAAVLTLVGEAEEARS